MATLLMHERLKCGEREATGQREGTERDGRTTSERERKRRARRRKPPQARWPVCTSKMGGATDLGGDERVERGPVEQIATQQPEHHHGRCPDDWPCDLRVEDIDHDDRLHGENEGKCTVSLRCAVAESGCMRTWAVIERKAVTNMKRTVLSSECECAR